MILSPVNSGGNFVIVVSYDHDVFIPLQDVLQLRSLMAPADTIFQSIADSSTKPDHPVSVATIFGAVFAPVYVSTGGVVSTQRERVISDDLLPALSIVENF